MNQWKDFCQMIRNAYHNCCVAETIAYTNAPHTCICMRCKSMRCFKHLFWRHKLSCWLKSAMWSFGGVCAVSRWIFVCKIYRNKGLKNGFSLRSASLLKSAVYNSLHSKIWPFQACTDLIDQKIIEGTIITFHFQSNVKRE